MFSNRERVRILPDNVIFWNLLTSGIYSKREYIKITLFFYSTTLLYGLLMFRSLYTYCASFSAVRAEDLHQ